MILTTAKKNQNINTTNNIKFKPKKRPLVIPKDIKFESKRKRINNDFNRNPIKINLNKQFHQKNTNTSYIDIKIKQNNNIIINEIIKILFTIKYIHK